MHAIDEKKEETGKLIMWGQEVTTIECDDRRKITFRNHISGELLRGEGVIAGRT